MNNPYRPLPVILQDVRVETSDRSLKTFTFTFRDPADQEGFTYGPGQFAELSIPGVGEIPIGIASSPTEQGLVRFTVFRTGKVTSFLHTMKPGDEMGIRGPLGNRYPLDAMAGRNVLIIGGGFAFTTLRSTVITMLEDRERFGAIHVVYGARHPGMLLYRDELDAWSRRIDIRMHVTVDSAGGFPDWQWHTGFVPDVVRKTAPRDDGETLVLLCGPPVMIKFTLPVLKELGYPESRIILSLENRMKCGIGMCGRCNIGKELVCRDGPVFTLEALSGTPMEY